MAAPRAVSTCLVLFVASSLTLCKGWINFSHANPKIFKRHAAAPAPAPAPAAGGKSEKCEKPLDVVFVLDSSEKVGMQNWEKIINGTIDIASKFDVKTTRFGVIQYQSYPETTIKLVKFNDDKSVAATLKKIFYKSGGKRTDLALNSTLDVFKDASVRSGSKVCILITGGPSADVYIDATKAPITGADLLKEPVDRLHSAEVAVYVVGIQENLSADEKKSFPDQMKLIASDVKADHMFEVPDYAKLADVAPKIANKSCVVNGGWSAWSVWSECRNPCMVKLRTRECNNPKPESGGLNCTGSKVEQFPCGSAAECQSTPKPGNFSTTPPPHQLITTKQTSTSAPVTNETTTLTTPPTTPETSPTTPTSTPALTPAPTSPSGIVVHGAPDPKNCGNGYEVMTLTDAQYDASTSYAEGPNEQVKQQSRIDHMPAMGKVNNTVARGAWCADHAKAVAKDQNQYLQLDLYATTTIGMVETQGQYYYPNAVSKFSLSSSNDGINWVPYGKVLDGNNDQNTRVDNHLNPAVKARYIRFIPKEFIADDICMRVAVFKCRQPTTGCRYDVNDPTLPLNPPCMSSDQLKTLLPSAPQLVPPKKDQPEDAWADKWANAARKSLIARAKKDKLIFKARQEKN